MINAKLDALVVVATALRCWQVAGVDTTAIASSNGIDGCETRAYTAGTDCWLVCPLGDGDRLDENGATITIVVKDGVGTPVPGIPAADVWLVGCSDGLVLCGGGNGIVADSATNVDGRTTMSGAMSAGGCDLLGVSVSVQGVTVTDSLCNILCLEIPAVSPDNTGPGGVIDGVVELADFSQFGLIYNKPADYDACWDFNCDTLVDLVDFSYFGLHWGHSCTGGP
jgi:hypothetical protein